jgi:branched-chain amino acid transport system substrate-binding protein
MLNGSNLRMAAAALGLATLASGAASAADYEIHVVIPTSGGGAFAGKGQQDSLDALASVVNKGGGLFGQNVKFVYHDDQTSPQVAVQLTNEVIAGKPKVIIGSSLVAMCRAMVPLVKNGPVHYCLSPGLHPTVGGFSFSSGGSSTEQIAATVAYYREKGWTKIAAMQTTDASGQDGDEGVKSVLARPENASMKLVALEHFNPTDISVTAQIERIKQSGAQAMISWSTGSPVATVFKGVIQGGLDIPVAPTSGNQTYAQMTQWADFLPKQLVLPSSLFPRHEGVFKLDPRVEKAQADLFAAFDEHKMKPDNSVANSWDAALIVIEGLRKIGPDGTAQQLRDFIANLQDFAGINGVYDFKKYPERGLGQEAAIVTRYDAATKSFVWLSKPGGAPLDK